MSQWQLPLGACVWGLVPPQAAAHSAGPRPASRAGAEEASRGRLQRRWNGGLVNRLVRLPSAGTVGLVNPLTWFHDVLDCFPELLPRIASQNCFPELLSRPWSSRPWSKSKQKQAKATKRKQKQAKASKSEQKQAKAIKSKQKQAKASKSKQKQAKANKSKQKQAKANKSKQKRGRERERGTQRPGLD